ncbi:MAG: hypothetical protein ACI4TL_06995, partial [Candidatus Cryptobacteroides sp.]
VRTSDDVFGLAHILISPQDPYCFYISHFSELLYQCAHGKISKIENETYSVKYIKSAAFNASLNEKHYIPEELLNSGYWELVPDEYAYDKILIKRK